MKKLFFLSLLSLVFSCAKKQENFQQITFKNPYKFDYQIKNKLAKDSLTWKFQIAAADYASKGNYKHALIMWDSVFPVRERSYLPTEIDSIKRTFTIANAIDFISSEAKKTQITIINEAHHSSLQRNFTKQLLQKLYNNGYKHLGLEALTNGPQKDTLLNTREYPIQTSGYYTKDPQFGNLIREALSIGFHVFAYEQTSNKNGKEREIEQAKNIQQVLTQFPNDKILIHCGFDHALEGIHRSWEKAMAEQLKELTNIDPLTINQVLYSEKSNSKFNHPLLKALDIKEASVLIDKNNKPLAYKRKDSWSDIAVLHPNTNFKNDKAIWIKNQVEIDLTNLELNYPIMALAYLKNEDINTAIPTDIVELQNKQDSILLYLEKGKYNIVITDSENSFLLPKNVD